MKLRHAGYINTPQSNRWILLTVASSAIEVDTRTQDKLQSLPYGTMRKIKSFLPLEKIPDHFPLEEAILGMKKESQQLSQ